MGSHCMGGWAPGHSVGCEQARPPTRGGDGCVRGELAPGEVCALVASPREADTGPHRARGPN